MQGPSFSDTTTLIFIFLGIAGAVGTLWWRIDQKIRASELAGGAKIAELHLRIDGVKDTYARKDDMKDGLRAIEEDIRGLRLDVQKLGEQIISFLKGTK